MATKKDDYMYKGFFVSHIQTRDKNNPNLLIGIYSVWGLGIYPTMAEAHQAVDEMVIENERAGMMLDRLSPDETKERERMLDREATRRELTHGSEVDYYPHKALDPQNPGGLGG